MEQMRGRIVLDTVQEIADPKHTALLVIDIQNDNSAVDGFLAQHGRDISSARRIIPRVKQVLDDARRLGLLIVFLRVTESSDGSLESDPLLRRLRRWNPSDTLSGYAREGTWGNQVLDDLEPRPNERQIIKYRSSAFIGTPLDLLLKNRGIKAAVVVGLATEGCVETTVRDLDQYGYYPIVLRDCVASRRKELHDAALLVMSNRYDVILSEELLKVWHSAPSAGGPNRLQSD